MSGRRISLNQELLALIFDGINILIWQQTTDGAKNRNRPESLYKKLMMNGQPQIDDYKKFDSPESYEKWRKSKMR